MSEYGEFQTGMESGELEQLHQESGSEQDYNSEFGVYAQDSASAESTDFETGRHVEYEDPSGARYEETEYTNYSHDEAETDSVFAADGSEQSSSADFSSMDALRAQFQSNFAQGTQFSGGDAGLSIASN
ncbi:hypothetical protein ACFFX1_21545 [Dactylosporangium sucinum]|uniref:Uncharacterized protein n=1 Tax=Dactylosporangium sucinum TaxID=1424081 RepID=A0A917UAR9_9ACTN|nr:hypothetical protein [Dactylosporangium sucinum]GGM67249.1 hypothetical protein GCM10007977_081160 [Dactylosporangium sucinum]